MTTSKLVLPTIATCRWREGVSGDAGEAQCQLVTRLFGADSGTGGVTRETCQSCCRSFPPSTQRWNPVVASLVYRAAARTIAHGGTDACPLDRAHRLQQLAQPSLDVAHPPHLRLTPRRRSAICYWRGPPVSATESLAPDSTEGSGAVDETRFHCSHAEHDFSSEAICRGCRDWVPHRPLSRSLSLPEIVPAPAERHGRRVAQWAVGITTAPRRQSTLADCLDSVVRAGWEQPRLFLDGTERIPDRYGHLPTTWREHAVGACPAWYLALAELYFQQPQADAYLILQDDVVVHDRHLLRSYLEDVLWPDRGAHLVSLFYTGHDLSPGWHRDRGDWHWGAQAFLFTPTVLRALLSDAALTRQCLSAALPSHLPIPSVLFDWARRTGTPIWYPIPSLTQHIGNSSTIWSHAEIVGGRRAAMFSGGIDVPLADEESLDEFPEQAFLCNESLRGPYRADVQRGLRRMRSSRAVICGLCRDARRYLPRTAARISRLGQSFADYRVVLFENDSVDATLEFLMDWRASDSRMSLISESLGTPRYPQIRSRQRAAQMAVCRERYRQYVGQHCADYDYVIVVDTDLAGGWSYDGVAHTLGQKDWDFVGSNGLQQGAEAPPSYVHFDVWAFRPAVGTPARRLVNHNLLELRRGEPLLPVESCFGGLGVYRCESFLAGEYSGGDCEHVTFHESLRRAGYSRLFLNPSQIVLYSSS